MYLLCPLNGGPPLAVKGWGVTLLGRCPECGVRDPYVSRVHCQAWASPRLCSLVIKARLRVYVQRGRTTYTLRPGDWSRLRKGDRLFLLKRDGQPRHGFEVCSTAAAPQRPRHQPMPAAAGPNAETDNQPAGRPRLGPAKLEQTEPRARAPSIPTQAAANPCLQLTPPPLPRPGPLPAAERVLRHSEQLYKHGVRGAAAAAVAGAAPRGRRLQPPLPPHVAKAQVQVMLLSGQPYQRQLITVSRLRRALKGALACSERLPFPSAGQRAGGPHPKTFSLLTWNLWYAPVGLEQRMRGVGQAISRLQCDPDVILLQEVSPVSYLMLASQAWFSRYHSSGIPPLAPPSISNAIFTVVLIKKATVGEVTFHQPFPFLESRMGRDLKVITATVHGVRVCVGNTHLESPLGFDSQQNKCVPRMRQLRECYKLLEGLRERNVFLAGDLNWLPLEQIGDPLAVLGARQWYDAWVDMHGRNHAGFTYDGKRNGMKPNGLQARLDRILCKTCDWQVASASLVGTKPIPGTSYHRHHRKTGHCMRELPLFCSDHFGVHAVFRLRL